MISTARHRALPSFSHRRPLAAITLSGWMAAAAIFLAGAPLASGQPSPPPAASPSATAPVPAAVPQAPAFQTPADLFEELTRLTKPVWRVQYRENIVRIVTSRQKAALGLGALMTDLYLAGMARDTQQIRNLSQDEESLEKLLGVTDKMAGHRQRIVMAAESSNWPELTRAVRRATERQMELLKELRDNDLAELIAAGHWLRAWQISTQVVISKKLETDVLAIGSPAMVNALADRARAMSDHAGEADRCLGLLARKTFALGKTWRNPTVETRQERLEMTQSLLAEMIDQLVQNKPAPPKAAAAETTNK